MNANPSPVDHAPLHRICYPHPVVPLPHNPWMTQRLQGREGALVTSTQVQPILCAVLHNIMKWHLKQSELNLSWNSVARCRKMYTFIDHTRIKAFLEQKGGQQDRRSEKATLTVFLSFYAELDVIVILYSFWPIVHMLTLDVGLKWRKHPNVVRLNKWIRCRAKAQRESGWHTTIFPRKSFGIVPSTQVPFILFSTLSNS